MKKNAIILLAEGFEEVEALTPVDYLRRAGIDVLTVAVGEGRTVKGARGIPVIADTTLKECQGTADLWDAVILPGGMPGSANLAASGETGGLLKKMEAAGKWLCAICAAPALALAPLGLLSGRRFTCYPGMETKVQAGEWSQER
ncbi:MAG: DJ-1/PfpI family protein, partial [Treponema sp.]|nr:DJ-1/PfpI family protein [Treponema sp.]